MFLDLYTFFFSRKFDYEADFAKCSTEDSYRNKIVFHLGNIAKVVARFKTQKQALLGFA